MQNELSALGQFPILQFFGGLFILMGIAFAVWKATKDSKAPGPTAPPAGIVAIGGALAERDLAERQMSTTHELIKTLNRFARALEESRICEEITDLRRSVDELGSIIKRQ